jgi:hypothetical protein
VDYMYKGEINNDHVIEIYFKLTYYNLHYIILLSLQAINCFIISEQLTTF